MRGVIDRREPVWGDLLMIVMRNKPQQVEEILLQCTEESLSYPITRKKWLWFRCVCVCLCVCARACVSVCKSV